MAEAALTGRCLRRPADFTRVAREFCADEAADGVRYVEVTGVDASFAPPPVRASLHAGIDAWADVTAPGRNRGARSG